MFLSLFVGLVSVCSLFCYAVLSVLSRFATILLKKRELVALLKLSSWCIVAVSVSLLFLAVPWVGGAGSVFVLFLITLTYFFLMM